MLKKFIFISSITTFLLASSNTLNDDIFDLTLEDLQNVIVTSASKIEERVIDAPARMVVINKEQINKRGYKSLNDLLSSISGFNVLNYNNSGYYNSVVVRGLNGSNYFKILQNGIEIDQTTGEVLGVGMNFPLFGVKRVEVLYGPASVIYGADAISGVINIITDDDEGVEGEIDYGEDGYKYYNFRFAKKINNTFYSIKGHFQDDQNYNFGKNYSNLYNSSIEYNGEVLENSDRNYDFAPNHSKSLNIRFENNKFSGGFNYSHLRSSTAMATISDSVLYEDKANYYTNLKGIFLTHNTNMFNDYYFSSTLSYDSSEIAPKSYFKNRYTNYEEAYKYSLGERYSFDEVITKKIDKHNITAGLSFERYHSIPLSYDLEKPFNASEDSDKQGFLYPNTDIPVRFYESYWSNSAIFIQDRININDVLKLSIAGRYDINTDYENSFNPRVALIYQQNENINHKLIYSEAFLAPSTYNKFKHYGAIEINDIEGDSNPYQSGRMRVPNENLEAEESRGVEYNIQNLLSEDFSIDVSIFYNKIRNLMTDSSITNDTESFPLVTVTSAKKNINSGKGEMYGAEIYFNKSFKFNNYKINLFGNYSYLEGSINLNNSGDSELPLISNHKINLGTTISDKNFFLTPSISWVDSFKTANLVDNSDKRTELKGVFIANLYGSYSFSKNYEISLNIKNLTNKNYSKPRESGGSFEVAPQPQRLAIIGIKFKF